MNRSTMMTYLALFLGTWVGSGHAQTQEHPPVEQYLMPQADEIALAKTAAPAISRAEQPSKSSRKPVSRSHNKR